jgi:ParB family chromosome partitioning protein
LFQPRLPCKDWRALQKEEVVSIPTTPKSQPVDFSDLIDIADIHVGKRLRELRPEKVAELAESMARQGQLHPIVVQPTRDGSPAFYDLVVGLHRLEAAKQLDWSKIRATNFSEMRDDDDAAALAEIDENLCCSELEPAERAKHIGRRKEIYERLHPETKQGAAPGKAGGGKKAKGVKNTSFAKGTAKATGRSKSSIDKDAKRAKDLGKFLDRINGTSLDKGAELDALAKLPEAEQEDLVARAAAGELVSAKAELAAKKSGAKSEPPAPVTGSVERAIEAVKAAGGALAGEKPPIDEARKTYVKAKLVEATEAANDASAALRGEPLPADGEPTERTARSRTDTGQPVDAPAEEPERRAPGTIDFAGDDPEILAVMIVACTDDNEKVRQLVAELLKEIGDAPAEEPEANAPAEPPSASDMVGRLMDLPDAERLHVLRGHRGVLQG